MKRRGINYKPGMLQAINEDRKTMTRRPIKASSGIVIDKIERGALIPKDWFVVRGRTECNAFAVTDFIQCPYGVPGDELYVRETHYVFGHWEQWEKKPGKMAWKFVPQGENFKVYYEDNMTKGYSISRDKRYPDAPRWYKRSPLFMPAEYARTILRITDIKAERLNDISEADAIREGVESWTEERMRSRPTHYKVYFQDTPDDPAFYCSTAVTSFETLWQSIHGKDSWKLNPWVWVISFEKV
jgi:hypothetical protein